MGGNGFETDQRITTLLIRLSVCYPLTRITSNSPLSYFTFVTGVLPGCYGLETGIPPTPLDKGVKGGFGNNLFFYQRNKNDRAIILRDVGVGDRAGCRTTQTQCDAAPRDWFTAVLYAAPVAGSIVTWSDLRQGIGACPEVLPAVHWSLAGQGTGITSIGGQRPFTW